MITVKSVQSVQVFDCTNVRQLAAVRSVIDHHSLTTKMAAV